MYEAIYRKAETYGRNNIEIIYAGKNEHLLQASKFSFQLVNHEMKFSIHAFTKLMYQCACYYPVPLFKVLGITLHISHFFKKR